MLGMIFLFMFWVLSWGGMLNGLFMLCGVWDKFCEDFVFKFFVVGVMFYGMVMFEGLMFLICLVSLFVYYIDWIIGYVYGGVLGWNGFMVVGMFYWFVLCFYGCELYLCVVVNWYFWIGMFGIFFYIVVMYISGIM